MYVKVDGQEWKLDFQYAQYLDESPRMTFCFFESESFRYHAKAICRPPDNFCKAEGRKLALTHTMKLAFPHDVPENKNKRKQVWEQYWATVKK